VIIYILNCIRGPVAAQRSNQDKGDLFCSLGGSRTAARLFRCPGVMCIKIELIAGYKTYNTVHQTCGSDVWATDEGNVEESPAVGKLCDSDP
jgi:hypothetical protein